MNYGVHSVMYFYYFLMAIKIRPPWAMMVTVLQISQMFVGVTFTVLNFIYVGSDQCTISHSNNLAAFGMYGSYLFLFLQFFISRYFVKSSQKKARKKEA
jgi:elongation of very long chain fatty acids protein 6